MASTGSRQLLAHVVGSNIAAARLEKGLTQRDLARLLDTDAMQVSRWERGEHRPSPAYEVRLAEQLFDGSVAALYTEDAA